MKQLHKMSDAVESEISVVIVNYKTPDLLMRCLTSLKQYAPAISDVIVIDNDSSPDTIRALQSKHPDVRRIASRTNAGFSKAVNWGITNARQKFVLILNPDIIVSENSVQILLRELTKNSDVGLIAPKLRYENGKLQPSCCRFQTPSYVIARRTWAHKTPIGKKIVNHVRMADYDHEVARDVDWVIGAAMLVRKAAIEQVGPMDERYWLYIEDMDWCRALWHLGWRVRYEPRSVMTHHYRRQSAKRKGVMGLLTPLGRAHFISSAKYFVKHIGNGQRLKRGQQKMKV